VGGGAVVTGLKERLERDLKRECPVGSHIKVKVGKGEAKGAFLGMQYIGRHEKDLVERMSFKREEYLSKNGNIFIANPWSNPKPAK
jgi:actin-related protein